MLNIAGYIGRKTLRTADHMMIFAAFIVNMLQLLISREAEGKKLVRRAILEQIYFTAVQALPIIIPVALLLGTLIIIQFTKVSSEIDLGKTVVLIVVREIGPFITALLVILRSATAVTIEIGYMNVLKETEALEMSGIDPLRLICLPRLIGITTAIMCLFIVFDIVAIMGGYYLVWIITDIPMSGYLDQIAKAISAVDIAVGIVKALCFGFSITAICFVHGFKTATSITSIPVAAAKAAVECFFYCLIINILISILFYI